jgi:hypothetical protein
MEVGAMIGDCGHVVPSLLVALSAGGTLGRSA